MDRQCYLLSGVSTQSNAPDTLTEGRIDLHDTGDVTGTLHETRILGGSWVAPGTMEFKISLNNIITTFQGTIKKKGSKRIEFTGTWMKTSGVGDNGTFKFACKQIPYRSKGYGRGDPIYTVLCITGDVLRGGTDSHVSIQLSGTKGVSNPIRLSHLNNTTSNEKCFLRGQVDEFEIYAEDIAAGEAGPLTSIVIQTDAGQSAPPPVKGAPPFAEAWFVDRIEVLEHSRNNWHVFTVKRWLDRKMDDGKTVRRVDTGSVDQAEALQIQLNHEAQANRELAIENERCRKILSGDHRLKELEESTKQTEINLQEAEETLASLKAKYEDLEEKTREVRENSVQMEATSKKLRDEKAAKTAQLEELTLEDERLDKLIKEKTEMMAVLSAGKEGLEQRILATEVQMDVLTAHAAARDLGCKEWEIKIKEKEKQARVVEGKHKKAFQDLQQWKVNLEGMKRDVDMHHQWAEKLKGLLEKQISYKADLQQKIELTMLETEDMQKAFKQCIADKQRAHIALVSDQKLHDEVEAKRNAQFKKRQETESYYAIEREKAEALEAEAHTLFSIAQENAERARATTTRLKKEEEGLWAVTETLDLANDTLAVRIVRNEQLTTELQKRVVRGKILQEDAAKIIKKLLRDAKALCNQRDLQDYPGRPAEDPFKDWPPLKELLAFRGKLDHLYEVFRLSVQDGTLDDVDPNRPNKPRNAGATILAELWEDNERLARLRREHAQAVHHDRALSEKAKNFRGPSAQDPLPTVRRSSARVSSSRALSPTSPGSNAESTKGTPRLSVSNSGRLQVDPNPDQNPERPWSKERGGGRSYRKSLQKFSCLTEKALGTIPTSGAASLSNMGRMNDEHFVATVKEHCPLSGNSAGPRLPLAETPGLMAIKRSWEQQAADKEREEMERDRRRTATASTQAAPIRGVKDSYSGEE